MRDFVLKIRLFDGKQPGVIDMIGWGRDSQEAIKILAAELIEYGVNGIVIACDAVPVGGPMTMDDLDNVLHP